MIAEEEPPRPPTRVSTLAGEPPQDPRRGRAAVISAPPREIRGISVDRDEVPGRTAGGVMANAQ